MARTCPKCGTQIVDDAMLFCPHCGIGLALAPTPSPPLTQPITSPLKKHRNLTIATIVTLAIIIVVVILVSPIVPIQSQYIVTKTRTRNLYYGSEAYGILTTVPRFVNVTNTDSIGGNFSVAMNKWSIRFVNLNMEYYVDATFTQSLYIAAGSTRTYNLPSDWIIISPMQKFTYSVSPPTTQENYNVTETKTEYKSILNLLLGS